MPLTVAHNHVHEYRAAGLEAKWSRTRAGAPAIFVRNPNATAEHQRTKWWFVSRAMFEGMQKRNAVDVFNEHTLLGDIFSIPA